MCEERIVVPYLEASNYGVYGAQLQEHSRGRTWWSPGFVKSIIIW